MNDQKNTERTVVCSFQIPAPKDKNQTFTMDEANSFIPLLSHDFLLVHQMQLMIQSSLRSIKRKGLDFALPLDRSKLDMSDNDLDEEAFDAVSNLKLLLKEIQNRVDTITSTGCTLESLEQGKVSWPSENTNNHEVRLEWAFGQDSVTRITSEKSTKTESIKEEAEQIS